MIAARLNTVAPSPWLERDGMTQARNLADLRKQILQARAMLGELHEAVAMAARQQTQRHSAELLAANQQLVVTALRAQDDADTATHALEIFTRTAELDVLTDLPNRAALLDRFNYTIAIAKRTGTQLALLFVDLNDFKQINDTLGHAVGDQVLKLVARRLASAVRGSDTVSRHGGDEFLILLTEILHASDVVPIAAKIITALKRTTRVGEHALQLTASIGISLFPSDGEAAGVLIDRADTAMYRAKRDGLGGFTFYGGPPPAHGSNLNLLATTTEHA